MLSTQIVKILKLLVLLEIICFNKMCVIYYDKNEHCFGDECGGGYLRQMHGCKLLVIMAKLLSCIC